MMWLLFWWWMPWFAVGRILGWLWCTIGWGRIDRWGGVRIIYARGRVADWFSRRGWAAFTFGDTVWLWSLLVTPQLVRHEGHHIKQWRAWGLLFPIVYLVLLARFGYRRHPFEVSARKAAAR